MAAEDSIIELITSFNELNAATVEELSEEPSPLEFMRFVATNTPFIIRRGASGWTATQRWSAQYLSECLQGQTVNIAVTPNGNADAPTLDGKGALLFAKPHEEDQPFVEFLEYIRNQEVEIPGQNSEVRYAQTQNDNLRHEYASLFSEVEKSVAFARIALQKEPDAINMWIGNSRSVTALHRDNYENIYVQIAGQKHFVLLPALCQPCVNEQTLPPANYILQGQDLVLAREEGDEVPFATWDPDQPGERATEYSGLARPLRVTLDPGDMLYLPAMWYHKVSQSCSGEGICVAVNYWYDMEFSGSLYPLTSFVRNVSRTKDR